MNININELTDEKIQGIIDEATLRCYIYNRKRSPEFTVEQWAKVFGQDTYLYELEMQRRLNK
jgi:hypothetical protein